MQQINCKYYSFKEENLICQLHGEQVRYYCICKEKFCQTCLIEGFHLKEHDRVRFIPSKEIKRVYIKEVELLENSLNQILEIYQSNDISNSENISNTSIKNPGIIELNQNINLILNVSLTKFFSVVFKDEINLINETKDYLVNDSEIEKILSCVETLELIKKSEELREKLKMLTIKTYEKMNHMQNLFITNYEKFQIEFELLLGRIFNIYDTNEIMPEITEVNSKSNSQDIKLTTNNEKEQVTVIEKINTSCIKNLSATELNDSVLKNEIYNLIKSEQSKKDLNFVNNEFSSSNFKHLVKSSSLWKEKIIPEFMSSQRKSNLSLTYTYNSPLEGIFGDILNHNMVESFNTEMIDKRSTDLNQNLENKNRINEIINFRKKRNGKISEKMEIENDKFFHYGYGGYKTFINRRCKILPSHLKNENTNYNIYYNYYNNSTPTVYNSNEIPKSTQICSDCFYPFKVGRFDFCWKKRCGICQRKYFSKTANLNTFYSYNSYKAGKTSQICTACKTSFIVPVALSKLRKTCYYCFKSGKS